MNKEDYIAVGMLCGIFVFVALVIFGTYVMFDKYNYHTCISRTSVVKHFCE